MINRLYIEHACFLHIYFLRYYISSFAVFSTSRIQSM